MGDITTSRTSAPARFGQSFEPPWCHPMAWCFRGKEGANAGAMRFMMQYDPGHGDYSKERHELFATLTLDELFEAVRPNPKRSTGEW